MEEETNSTEPAKETPKDQSGQAQERKQIENAPLLSHPHTGHWIAIAALFVGIAGVAVPLFTSDSPSKPTPQPTMVTAEPIDPTGTKALPSAGETTDPIPLKPSSKPNRPEKNQINCDAEPVMKAKFFDASSVNSKSHHLGTYAQCHGTHLAIDEMITSLFEDALIPDLSKSIHRADYDRVRSVAEAASHLSAQELFLYLRRIEVQVPQMPLTKRVFHTELLQATLRKMAREKFSPQYDLQILQLQSLTNKAAPGTIDELTALLNGASITPRFIAEWALAANNKDHLGFKINSIENVLKNEPPEVSIYATGSFLGKLYVSRTETTVIKPLCHWLSGTPSRLRAQPISAKLRSKESLEEAIDSIGERALDLYDLHCK